MRTYLNYNIKLATETSCFQIDNLSELNNLIQQEYTKTVFIIEESVYHFHADLFIDLQSKVILKPQHELKSFESMMEVIKKINEFELDRKSLLVAIGGGELSDLIGFVASIYLRGISFGVLPTTVLNMVDASIGGKNGINFNRLKNQLGTIYQPKFIGFYIPFLDSLPRVENSAGLAEVIKYGLTSDLNLYSLLEGISLNEFIQNESIKSKIIEKCIRIKSDIISLDPTEKGERKVLNFGHTIGHALEVCCNLNHGEAVGLGMLMAIKISERELNLDAMIFEKVKEILIKFELPTKLLFDPALVYDKLVGDKKRVKEEIEFILINEIGLAERKYIPLERIKSYLIQSNKERWI